MKEKNGCSQDKQIILSYSICGQINSGDYITPCPWGSIELLGWIDERANFGATLPYARSCQRLVNAQATQRE